MNIDPASIAAQFAQFDIAPYERRYTQQLSEIRAEKSGVNSIKSALNKLDQIMYDYTKIGSSLKQNEVKLSDDSFFDVNASGTADAANLDIFVEQLATNHQVLVTTGAADINDEFGTVGKITVTQGGVDTLINVAKADSDGDGSTSYVEFVNYFNSEFDGVTAALVKSSGEVKMLFSSDSEGVDNAFQIKANANSGHKADFTAANDAPIVEAQDSIIYLGAEGSGGQLTNSSNHYEDLLQNVDITLKKSHDTGAEPSSIDISNNASATIDSMKKFVDGYNSVMSEISRLTSSGSETEARGVLASDSSIRAIKNQMNSAIRGEFAGVSLYAIGLEINRDGTLELDEGKFSDNLEDIDLNAVFTDDGGLFKELESKINTYTDYSTGTFKSKTEQYDQQVMRINKSLERLDLKYESNYNRYLSQYTNLNRIQAQMNSVSGMFG